MLQRQHFLLPSFLRGRGCKRMGKGVVFSLKLLNGVANVKPAAKSVALVFSSPRE